MGRGFIMEHSSKECHRNVSKYLFKNEVVDVCLKTKTRTKNLQYNNLIKH